MLVLLARDGKRILPRTGTRPPHPLHASPCPYRQTMTILQRTYLICRTRHPQGPNPSHHIPVPLHLAWPLPLAWSLCRHQGLGAPRHVVARGCGVGMRGPCGCQTDVERCGALVGAKRMSRDAGPLWVPCLSPRRPIPIKAPITRYTENTACSSTPHSPDPRKCSYARYFHTPGSAHAPAHPYTD